MISNDTNRLSGNGWKIFDFLVITVVIRLKPGGHGLAITLLVRFKA
jgi:hypothetical protein